MSKKIQSWILVVAMVLSFVVTMPITANAAAEGDWTYTLYDGDTTAAITGYTGTDTELVIPSTIAGKPVTRIGSNAFIDNTTITSVTIPDSVLRIESSAFQNSMVLTIDLGDGLTYIGQNAFNGSKLANVTIPDSVTQIDNNAFANNRNLTSVTINGNNLLSLGDGAFSITSLSTIRIPTSLSAIPSWAFNDTSLNSLTIPANITSVGYYAFGNNFYLNSVIFEGNAPTMGNYVFSIPSSGFTVYYYSGATGFTTPTWTAGYATLDTVELARPITYVCEVDGVQYETLDEGLSAAAIDEDTIKLLTDIDYTGQLSPTADTWINLNGYTLNVVNDTGAALLVNAGIDVYINGEGSFNVIGSSSGVIIGEGSSAEVTNATATAANGVAVNSGYADSSATILGDVTADGTGGAFGVAGYGNATIYGDVSAQGTGGTGVAALGGSNITVRGYITAPNYLSIAGSVKTQAEYSSIANNYYVYTDGSATVRARQEVCSLDGENYLFLEDALADAEDGDTITLLADIRYQNEIILIEKDLHFDLDTYKLDLGRTGSDGALKVDGSTLTIDDTNGGKLNIVDGYVGIRALNEGSATVSSISGLNGYGIVGESGGLVLVKEDISVLSYMGVGFNLNSGASAHVMGNIYSLDGISVGSSCTGTVDGNITASNGPCVEVGGGGSVIVEGDVHGNYYTVRGGSGGGSVHVKGNVIADRWNGVEAYGGSNIVIDGSVSSPYGPYAWGEGTTVLIKQNTTTTDPAYWGAYAFGGAEISVDGTITAADPANYVKVGDTVMTEGSFTINGNGYYLYTDDTSSVMVKINTCLIDGCSTSLEDGGFTQYSVIDDEIYYHVTNAAQLAHINSHLDQNYLQMNDIDLTEIDWTPIGSRFYPGFELGFDGIYDGNGYLISNLTIGSSSTPKTGGDQTQAGLFGAIRYSATLRNINVTVDIHTDGVTNVGGLVGYSESNGTVSNCSAGGSISTIGTGTSQVGGLIGYVSNTSILECSSDVTITAETGREIGGLIGSHGAYSYDKLRNISNSIFTGTVDGGNSYQTGGIAGSSYGNAFIVNSINTGSVTAANGNVGGIAGKIHNNVANCYNIGSVSNSGNSSDKVGGIVAFIDSGYVKNCYNAGTVSNPGGAIAGALVADVSSYDTASNLYSDKTVNPSLDPVNITNGTSYYLYNLTTEEMKGAAPSQPLEYGEGLTASEIVSALNGWIDEFNYSEADIAFAQWDMDSSVNSGYAFLIGVPMENNAELDSLLITEGTLSPTFSKDIDVYAVNVLNSIDELSVTAIARSENASISINGENVSTSAVQLAVGNNTIEIIVTAENGFTTNKYTVNITRAAASSSGGGSSYTAPTIVVITEEKNNSTTNSTELSPATTSGTTSATVSTAIVEALLDKISSDGGALKNDRIDLVVDTTAGTKELKVDILQADLAKIIDKTDASLSITSPFISIVFDEKALKAISSAESGGRVVISAGIIDNDSLTEADKAKTKGRPVYDLSVMNGDTQVSRFNGGHATVTIPYELQAGENPNAVVIYYLSDDGKLIAVRGHYDADLKAVVFKTTHFSNFIIGYNLVSFNDVAADAWYKNAIDFIAAREITSGTSNDMFSPEAKLTRAQFVVLLMNAYQINTQNQSTANQIQNFSDAGNTYYTEYLFTAKTLGIVNGVGNNMFAPEQAITRQEMFVMLYNALDVIEELPQASSDKQLSDFGDENQVASWAQDAMSALIEGGVISGSNGMLNPTASTTRAEMAQMLYNLLSK